MESRVNIGSFREDITVYYLNSNTVSNMGEETPTYTTYNLLADVNQLSGSQAVYLGMNVDDRIFRVIFRPPSTARPVKITYKGVSMNVKSVKIDKFNQFSEIIVANGR